MIKWTALLGSLVPTAFPERSQPTRFDTLYTIVYRRATEMTGLHEVPRAMIRPEPSPPLGRIASGEDL
jgi:hypothetical protein